MLNLALKGTILQERNKTIKPEKHCWRPVMNWWQAKFLLRWKGPKVTKQNLLLFLLIIKHETVQEWWHWIPGKVLMTQRWKPEIMETWGWRLPDTRALFGCHSCHRILSHLEGNDLAGKVWSVYNVLHCNKDLSAGSLLQVTGSTALYPVDGGGCITSHRAVRTNVVCSRI